MMITRKLPRPHIPACIKPATGIWADPRSDGSGWYVADNLGADLLGITYATKRDAVRKIRLMSR
jgi:hypothetical protein